MPTVRKHINRDTELFGCNTLIKIIETNAGSTIGVSKLLYEKSKIIFKDYYIIVKNGDKYIAVSHSSSIEEMGYPKCKYIIREKILDLYKKLM